MVRVVASLPRPAVEGVRQLGVVSEIKLFRGNMIIVEKAVLVIVTISPPVSPIVELPAVGDAW